MARTSSANTDILIVDAGVFGISTALALAQRPKYRDATITIVDAAPQLPNPQAASTDTSRILRADYAVQAYTNLVGKAKQYWRDTSDSGWGGQGRYHQAGLLLTAQPDTEGHVEGYLEDSLANVQRLARSELMELTSIKSKHCTAERKSVRKHRCWALVEIMGM